MTDMNDMYVNDFCSTKVHCRGFVFTLSELFDIALEKLTFDELVEHMDKKNS